MNWNDIFENVPKVYKGVKNKTILPEFANICKLTQPVLKRYVNSKLNKAGYTTICKDGYVYAKGDIPILLTAHMDTVHEKTVIDFYEYIDKDGNHIISSPQGIGGDDRCGVWIILEIIKSGLRPSILFCEDEEIGGIGSKKFCKSQYINDLKEMKFLIELDRMNANDAVYYDTYNTDFFAMISEITGYKMDIGSFSDISHLSDACDVASVNLSCGYYHAHTLNEEVCIEEMKHTYEVVKELLKMENKLDKYVFDDGTRPVPTKSYYSWDDDYYMFREDVYVEIIYENNGEQETQGYIGSDEWSCLGQFFNEHPDKCYNDIVQWYEV